MPWVLALGTLCLMLRLRLCTRLALLAGSPLGGRPAGTLLFPLVIPGRRLAMAVGCTFIIPPRLLPPAYAALAATIQVITSGSRWTFSIAESMPSI
uniref:Putative secreted protein n=1 Tax=Ixodes ricinus TaxID=34613 RepID=A0A6B0U467_IXORI